MTPRINKLTAEFSVKSSALGILRETSNNARNVEGDIAESGPLEVEVRDPVVTAQNVVG